MGYVLTRRRRVFLREVPGADSPWFGLVTVEMTVMPYHGRWRDGYEWEVHLLHREKPNPSVSTRGRRAGTITGRCRHQDDAWAQARAITNEVRALIAARESLRAQRRTDTVPL